MIITPAGIIDKNIYDSKVREHIAANLENHYAIRSILTYTGTFLTVENSHVNPYNDIIKVNDDLFWVIKRYVRKDRLIIPCG